VPRLLAEVRRLRAEVARLERAERIEGYAQAIVQAHAERDEVHVDAFINAMRKALRAAPEAK
jgi:hypothetical protein